MKVDNNLPLTSIDSQSLLLPSNEVRQQNFSKILQQQLQDSAKTQQSDKTDVTEKNEQSEWSEQQLRKASQDLEAVFLSKMFEIMRSTIIHSDLIPRSFAEETFESMLYDEYAKNISKTGGLGIAESIYRQLSGINEQNQKYESLENDTRKESE
jgi:flagellar protein FlgJ